MWMTETVSSEDSKPKLPASGDVPSRISTAPPFTRVCQSEEGGVLTGATTISADAAGPGRWPAAERMAGHGPGCGPNTAKVPPWHRVARIRGRELFRNRIPDSGAEIVIVGAAGIAFIHQI